VKLKKALVIFVLVAMVSVCFAGCIEEPSSAPTATPTSTVTPTTTKTTPTPTPAPTPKTELSLGEGAIVDDISFTVVRYEFTDSYEAGYGEKHTHHPPEGAKYLWVYVKAKNVGELAYYIPYDYGVDLLYKGEEIMCTHTEPYFEEKEMYRGSMTKIYPNVTKEGWVFYEVPKGIDISQAKIRVEFDTRTVTWSLTS
jgi:hypothetical protein